MKYANGAAQTVEEKAPDVLASRLFLIIMPKTILVQIHIRS